MTVPDFSDQELLILEISKRIAALRYYFRTGLRNPERIRRLLQYNILPVKLSTKKICNEPDHVCQYDFFQAMLLDFLQFVVIWACRGGSKTYLVSLLSWLDLNIFPKLEISILGGSEEQSRLSTKAMLDFWKLGDEIKIGYLLKLYVKSLAAERVILKNDSICKTLAASETSARGGHPQILVLDEIDVMKTETFESVLSQPQSKNDVPGCTWILSTNHRMGGNMDVMIERAREMTGARIFKWCVFEILEACDGACSTCKLSSICPGKQMMEATGYYKIEDFIKKMETLSRFTLETEWLCRKPGSPDLVYGNEFDPDVHIIDAQFDPTKMVIIAVDWGGINPFAVLVFQDFRNITGTKVWVVVDEIYIPNSTTPAVIVAMKQRPWFANHILYAVCDHNQDANKQLRESKRDGIDVRLAKKDVETGIARVKAKLKPVLGLSQFKIARHCKHTIREFLSYRQRNGRIVKENDHTCDAVQYFFAGLDEMDDSTRRSAAISRKEESINNMMR